ncbi:hypothetical protein FPOAC1_005060 [Fusarium poae]|uniref:hypothetical protein n=1 Tax=Fusarium poae TaxID=36050 RepID=UPI001CEA9DF5|nr:hypothetical protein FPOAC1_005060 [Fusarium poae]KAG8671802.1 hypothetical protein FPOAC1_005060 [Fusarium poae]
MSGIHPPLKGHHRDLGRHSLSRDLSGFLVNYLHNNTIGEFDLLPQNSSKIMDIHMRRSTSIFRFLSQTKVVVGLKLNRQQGYRVQALKSYNIYHNHFKSNTNGT